MLTYTIDDNPAADTELVINLGEKNDTRDMLSAMLIHIENTRETKELTLLYPSYLGLLPSFIYDNNRLLTGAGFGAVIIDDSLAVSEKIMTSYPFCNAFFLDSTVLIVFECEIVLYSLTDGCVTRTEPLPDLIENYYISEGRFIYNTFDNSDYRSIKY